MSEDSAAEAEAVQAASAAPAEETYVSQDNSQADETTLDDNFEATDTTNKKVSCKLQR